MKKFKALAALLAAFTLTVGAATATGCGNDNGGKKDDDTHIDVEGVEAPASTNKLLISKTTTSYTLTEENPTVTIDASDVTVKFAQNSTELGTVAAGDYTLEYYKGATKVANLNNISEAGTYYIVAVIENAVVGDATTTTTLKSSSLAITVANPVKADTFALKSGTTTQVQGTTDEISGAWIFEVTLNNGTKVEIPNSAVSISGFSPVSAGSFTATVTATYDGVALSTTVDYTITADENVVAQSFALNFGNLTDEQIASIKAGTETTVQDGRFVVRSTGSGDIATHGKEIDGKYFAYRLKVNGASTAAGSPRYIKVHADGAGTLTVYAYNNSTSEGRGVAVYTTCTIAPNADGKDVASFDGQIGETQVPLPKTDTKLQFTLPAAGDYYITCDAGMTFTYVQLDQMVSSEGNTEITLGGTEVASKIAVSSSSEGNQSVTLGDQFSNAGYTVTATVVNDVTCDSRTTDVTSEATFTAPEDFTTVAGKKTITVSYGNCTDTYSIYVCAIGDVYDVTVSGGSSYQIGLNDTQVTANLLTDVTATVNTVTADNASNYTATVTKIADGEGNEVTADGISYTAAGEHTYTVTVSITDGTDTVTIEKELTVRVTKEVAAGTYTNVTYDVASYVTSGGAAGTFAADTVLYTDDGVTITALTSTVLESNNATINDVSYTYRLKTNGGFSTSAKGIKIDLSAGATITVVCKGGGTSVRTASIYDSNGTVLQSFGELTDSTNGQTYSYTAETAGTYYFGATNGFNVYAIIIEYV